MAEALNKGFHAGVKNHKTDTIVWYNGGDFQKWIEENNKWGKTIDFQTWTYIIASNKFYKENSK